MGQLVPEHALELRGLEQVHQPCGHANRRVLGRAADGESVWHRRLRYGDLGLAQIGRNAQPIDDRVKLGRLLGRDLAGAHREERDLVGGEQLYEEQPCGDDHDGDRAGTSGDKGADQHGIDESEQEHRQ